MNKSHSNIKWVEENNSYGVSYVAHSNDWEKSLKQSSVVFKVVYYILITESPVICNIWNLIK